MILIWFGNGAAFLGFPMGWLGKRKLKEPRDRLLVGFARVFITGYDFDTVLIRF